MQQLQERLLELGYLTGKATGYYGTVTQQAVMDYQKYKGLTVDGKAGPETLRSLMGKKLQAVARQVRYGRRSGRIRSGRQGRRGNEDSAEAEGLRIL